MSNVYLDDVTRVTSIYGEKRTNGVHAGIDIKAGRSGSINPPPVVYSPHNCLIDYTSEGYNYGRGTNVILRWDEEGTIYRLRLQHLKQLFVKKGTIVLKGEPIGLEGATGNCIGQYPEHTHCELRAGGYIAGNGEISGSTLINPCGIIGVNNVKGSIGWAMVNSVDTYIIHVLYASIGDRDCLVRICNSLNVNFVETDYNGSVEAPTGNELKAITMGPMTMGDYEAIEHICEDLCLDYEVS